MFSSSIVTRCLRTTCANHQSLSMVTQRSMGRSFSTQIDHTTKETVKMREVYLACIVLGGTVGGVLRGLYCTAVEISKVDSVSKSLEPSLGFAVGFLEGYVYTSLNIATLFIPVICSTVVCAYRDVKHNREKEIRRIEERKRFEEGEREADWREMGGYSRY